MQGGDQRNVVMLADAFGRLALDFSTYEQARDFALWMNQNGAWLQRPIPHPVGKDGYWLSWAGGDDGSSFPPGKFGAHKIAMEGEPKLGGAASRPGGNAPTCDSKTAVAAAPSAG